MAKAIYILDKMPDGCAKCGLFNSRSNLCYLNFSDNKDPRYRARECPLKELPERKELSLGDFSFQEGFIVGWNECLGEIEREEN